MFYLEKSDLYFEVIDVEKLPMYKQGLFHLNGSLVSKENVQKVVFDRKGEFKKFSNNGKDLETFITDGWSYPYIEKVQRPLKKALIVWLGDKNNDFYNCLKTISSQDLWLLSKNIYDVDPSKKRCYFFIERRKYKRGSTYRNAKNSRAKNLAKNALAVEDYKKEYPVLKNKKPREKIKMSFHASWDFYDYTFSRKGNGWKEQTKVKKQYLKKIV